MVACWEKIERQMKSFAPHSAGETDRRILPFYGWKAVIRIPKQTTQFIVPSDTYCKVLCKVTNLSCAGNCGAVVRGTPISPIPFKKRSWLMVRLNAPFHSSVIVSCSRLQTSHNLPGSWKTPSMSYVELSSIITITTKTLHVFLLIAWLDITFHYIVDIRIISHLIVERAVRNNTFKLFLPFGLI